MNRTLQWLCAVCLLSLQPLSHADDALDQARALLDKHPIIDGHNDHARVRHGDEELLGSVKIYVHLRKADRKMIRCPRSERVLRHASDSGDDGGTIDCARLQRMRLDCGERAHDLA